MGLETQDGIVIGGSGGGGPSTIDILDEGLNVASTTKINFTGKDITASYNAPNGRVDVATTREDVFNIEASRASNNTTNIYLRGTDGLHMNISPYTVGVNSEIFAISISSAVAQTYTIEVYKNTDILSSPNQVDAILVFNVVNSRFAYNDLLSIGLVQGDDIAIYMRGSNIDHPRVNLLIRRL